MNPREGHHQHGRDADSDRMTEGQRSYLIELCEATGESFDEDMSIAQANRRIHELEQRSSRPS